MASCDAVAAPENDTAAEKEQVDQIKVCRQNEEEVGEATSSSSMKSPVTPAALWEGNGTPALRWKSYTAKQKELDSHEKLACGLSAPADSKGKLVINLCGSTRSLMKASSTGSEIKGASSLPKNLEASGSSHEQVSPPNKDDDAPSPRAPMDIVAPQSLPSGSSESVQNCVKEMCTFKRPNANKDLVKMVCRRIRMVRSTLKSSEKRKSCRNRLRSYANKVKSCELDWAGVANSKAKGIKETACNLVKEACFGGRRGPGGAFLNLAIDEQDAASRSEDLIYSEDDERSGNLQIDRKVLAGFTSNGPAEYIENKIEVSMKDLSSACAGVKEVLPAVPQCSQLMSLSANDVERTSRDDGTKDLSYGRGNARSLSHEPGAFPETSKLDMKEQTVLETLLRDEPTGYSSGGGSEPSRSHRVEKSGCEGFVEKYGKGESDQPEDSGSTDAESDCSQSDGYDEVDSASSESHECDEEECNCNGLSPSTRVSPSKGLGYPEQVPSVLCDAEGNIWHIGKREEQARGKGLLKQLCPSNRLRDKSLRLANKVHPVVLQQLGSEKSTGQGVAPHSQEIELNWKWPSVADYSISLMGDVSSRSLVYKEKAIFVGCIPDGTENLEEILQNLMEKFLERFDFVPSILGQIQLVKVVKDFAFLELATEKVAHIVLAANQLDVFEWGVNGFHFNIEGCKGTHTSVRPLIEYIPLKPARVIFVGNIPKPRWQKAYLEAFFARILKGGDGADDRNLVNCVYLLPESCDAYIELTSEVMADAIIFKCTKHLHILKEIGEDVFICRDPSSVPLMSKHTGNVCPQRSLYVGVSAPGQEFKIDLVRKVFEDILPMVTRETKQPGYLEFISIQPGKDYAFFQFNSESIVDAVMEEYVLNTHLFVCNNSSLSYIILRPPGYVRPGARYRSDRNRNDNLGMTKSSITKNSKYENGVSLGTSRHSESLHMKQLGMVPLLPRRFGDEPTKKTDCIMLIGASPLPEASWNGLSSTGSRAADPECMLIIEGLPKGLSFKLLQGALNELFEKSLSTMGLLEVGMLVLRHLDRDINLDVAASLPSAKIVRALLSLRKTFIVAGNELKLLPKGGKWKITWNGKIAEHGRGQGEVSCVSDDEAYQDKRVKGPLGNVRSIPTSVRHKRTVSHIVSHVEGRKHLASRRKQSDWDSEIDLTTAKGALEVLSRRQIKKYGIKPSPLQQWRENALKGMKLHVQNATGPLKFGKRDPVVMSEAQKNAEDFPSEILHIVSKGGKRRIQSVSVAPKLVRDSGTASLLKLVGKKRKLFQLNDSISAQKAVIMQRSFKKHGQVSRIM